MFCKKCGASIPDDCEFCSACGSKAVLTEEAPAEVSADIPAEAFSETPVETVVKTKKRGLFVKLVCIVLAVAVVFTSAFFVFKDNMMGLVMSVMPAEKQMQYTYSRLAKNLSNDFSEDYALALERIDSSYSGEMTLDVEASKELLSSFFTDEESIINTASLIYSIDVEGTDRYGMDMGIKVKDTVLVNFQIFIDMSEQKMVMAVPGIIDGAVELDLTENMSSDDAENFRILQTLTTSENLKKLLPKKELVKTILPKLVKAAFAEIENVEREKSEFEAGGVTQKANCLEFEITSEVLAKMAIGALEEVKKNKDIKEYVEDLADLLDEHKDILEIEPLDTDDLYDDMIDGVDEIIDELEDVDSDEELLTVKTWVNGKFDIIALDVEIPGVGTGFFGMANDGKKRGFELSVSDLSETIFNISGELELNKDKLEGEFDAFSGNNHVANIKVEDMDALKLRKGLINGTFTLTFGTEFNEELRENLGVADPAIIFTIESEEKAVTIKADFTSEGKSLVAVTLSETISDKGGEVKIPTDTTDNIEEWAQGVDQQELLDRLEKIGITEDMLNSLFMGSYEDDYDSSYEDSFGMDEEFLYY